jgi:hypothetical protein
MAFSTSSSARKLVASYLMSAWSYTSFCERVLPAAERCARECILRGAVTAGIGSCGCPEHETVQDWHKPKGQ